MLTRKEIERFANVRHDLALNYHGAELAAKVREHASEVYTDPSAEDPSLFYVNDPGHGYLAVPKGHRFYEMAKAHEGTCSRRYRSASGTVLLEEDCDAPAFMRQMRERIAIVDRPTPIMFNGTPQECGICREARTGLGEPCGMCETVAA